MVVVVGSENVDDSYVVTSEVSIVRLFPNRFEALKNDPSSQIHFVISVIKVTKTTP